MKCKVGDIAKIIMSIRPENIGKKVAVDTLIGHFKQGDTFDFRGVECTAQITNFYCRVSSETYSLTNILGDTPKTYIPDSWLEPLTRIKVRKTATEEVDISA